VITVSGSPFITAAGAMEKVKMAVAQPVLPFKSFMARKSF